MAELDSCQPGKPPPSGVRRRVSDYPYPLPGQMKLRRTEDEELLWWITACVAGIAVLCALAVAVYGAFAVEMMRLLISR